MSCCRRVDVIRNKAGVDLALQAAFGRNFTDNQFDIHLVERLHNAAFQVFERGRKEKEKVLRWQQRRARKPKQTKRAKANGG